MIYLIGCDHNTAQTYLIGSGLDDTHKEFRRLLLKAIQEHKPELIAEEHYPDSLKEQERHSIAYEVASENCICHRFCEPSPSKKKKLGVGRGINIPNFSSLASSYQQNFECYRHIFAHRWPIREEFWITQLGDDIHRRVLFICGAGHRETLRRRLKSRGIEVKIIRNAKRFGASEMPKSHFAAYKDVRRNGFPPVTDGSDSRCICIQPQK